jgi:CHC2-type zinc finger protein
MGMKAPVTGWTMTAQGDRIEWSEVKDRIDLGIIATALLGPAPGRRGSKGGRIWWHCPFHEDANPSFAVKRGKDEWRCFGCSEHGDAAALVMRLKNLDFPAAVKWLAEQVGVRPRTRSDAVTSRKTIIHPVGGDSFAASTQVGKLHAPDQPSGIPLADALALVETAEKSLWAPEGMRALTDLRGRGLEDGTIRSARLGFTPGVNIPKKSSPETWEARGVTIPWFDSDRLAMVKIRQPNGREPKYGEAFRDRPALYPAPSEVRPGKPSILCEGEFDALLLRQELDEYDLAVVTLGSASARAGQAVQDLMLTSPVWYLALDGNEAGDKNATVWPARAKRVKPPAPFKDWGDAHKGGFNLIRYIWGGILRRPRSPWEVLQAQRWGSAQSEGAS